MKQNHKWEAFNDAFRKFVDELTYANDPALGLGVPVARLRLGAFAASAAIAGLAGALGVELAQVADPSGYGPVLSFKLFVAVILGGAPTPLGPVAGLVRLE